MPRGHPVLLPINELWASHDETRWRKALDRYWEVPSVKRNLELYEFMQTLDSEWVRNLDSRHWYDFLRDKYYPWKFTAKNRLASNVKRLKRYEDQGKLEYLNSIKKRLFAFNVAQIGTGLDIATEIDGLGPAGASGLLAVLFPQKFGCADQFVVKSLCEVASLPERAQVLAIKQRWKPGLEVITAKESILLVGIMRRKANDLNVLFGPDKWNPRKIDMILFASRSGSRCGE